MCTISFTDYASLFLNTSISSSNTRVPHRAKGDDLVTVELTMNGNQHICEAWLECTELAAQVNGVYPTLTLADGSNDGDPAAFGFTVTTEGYRQYRFQANVPVNQPTCSYQAVIRAALNEPSTCTDVVKLAVYATPSENGLMLIGKC